MQPFRDSTLEEKSAIALTFLHMLFSARTRWLQYGIPQDSLIRESCKEITINQQLMVRHFQNLICAFVYATITL